MSALTYRGRPAWRALAAGSALALTASLVAVGTPGSAAEQTLPVFAVVQEGLTPEEGHLLGEAFGLPNALEANGAFNYLDAESFNAVPLMNVGQGGYDEADRRTVAQAIDFGALEELKPIDPGTAIDMASQLLDVGGVSPYLEPEPEVSHAELTLSDAKGRVTDIRPLDTTVGYRFTLAGLPVTGQGARLRVTFAPDGTVSQLAHSLRKVEPAGDVAVIDESEARDRCAALYGPDVDQETPTLGYQFPELGAEDANGQGRVREIYPQYTCNPVARQGEQAHRLVPAVPDAAPAGELWAGRDDDRIDASVSVSGGAEPYTYAWSSSSTVLEDVDPQADSISYERRPRDSRDDTETVTVEVTDANGLTATASITFTENGDQTVEMVPGGGGFGVLAVGPVDVGIEQTVDEWQCAQDSANGFRDVMASKGIARAFDWRGYSAWEKDFKDTTKGGGDSTYVDNVDAAWYTGHGWSGGFTFKSSVTDTEIVPGDARWGDRDLEWLQLESCQVLRDTTGSHDYFSRWRQVFQGLHMLNGFDTNAYCVSGGTGRAFAQNLFPKKFLWWTLAPAQPVRKAWAQMAIAKEPSGVKYRSMGPLRSDGVSNIGDYFWGQGPVGPDLPMTASMGMWAVSGTV